jgi:ferredoxin
MDERLHLVDLETCTGDGICAEVCPENAHLVCHHSMLAAVSLGLGTTIIGLIPPIVERSKILRERYGIPKENRVLTSLILGYPKYRYRQSIRRDLAGVQYH